MKLKKLEGKKGVHLFFFCACQYCSCSSFNSPIIQPLLVYKSLTTDDQINESSILFILIFNLPDTILYNEFTLFVSQFSSVQILTAPTDRLTDPIKYFISSICDLTLWATSQTIIKSNALLHKPQLFIGSLEKSRRCESETSR